LQGREERIAFPERELPERASLLSPVPTPPLSRNVLRHDELFTTMRVPATNKT